MATAGIIGVITGAMHGAILVDVAIGLWGTGAGEVQMGAAKCGVSNP